MSFTARSKTYLRLAQDYIDGKRTPSAFTRRWMTLWKEDRDEQYLQKQQWPEPYDEQLDAERQAGMLSADEYLRKNAEIWGYREDRAFYLFVDSVFSACSSYQKTPEFPGEIDEKQLRVDVESLLRQYFSSKADK